MSPSLSFGHVWPKAQRRPPLPGCLKLYLPARPWGAVLAVVRDIEHDRLELDFLAFGLRHPPAGRRASVYQLAHRRLHRSSA